MELTKGEEESSPRYSSLPCIAPRRRRNTFYARMRRASFLPCLPLLDTSTRLPTYIPHYRYAISNHRVGFLLLNAVRPPSYRGCSRPRSTPVNMGPPFLPTRRLFPTSTGGIGPVRLPTNVAARAAIPRDWSCAQPSVFYGGYSRRSPLPPHIRRRLEGSRSRAEPCSTSLCFARSVRVVISSVMEGEGQRENRCIRNEIFRKAYLTDCMGFIKDHFIGSCGKL